MPKNNKERPTTPTKSEQISSVVGDILFVGVMTVIAGFPALASYAAERSTRLGEGEEQVDLERTVQGYQHIAFMETIFMGLLLAASEFTPTLLNSEQLHMLTLWYGLNALLIMYQANNLRGSSPPTGTGA